MDKVRFFLPSFTKNLEINIAFINFLRENPECYHDGIEISSLFGSFPNAIWNGGRCELGNVDIPKFQDIVEILNSMGISIRYTFTNCLLQEEHLYDEYCNQLMQIANNGMNEVLVNSSLLEKYLRNNYPNFKYILSTTTMIRGVQTINNACEKYDLVVADYRDVRDTNFLDSLTMRDKVEILLNETCAYDCLFRGQHYKEISKAQLRLQETNESLECLYRDSSRFNEAVISPATVWSYLVPKGFSNFKLRGRIEIKDRLMDNYISYMVKSGYQDIVRKQLM